MDGRTLMLYPKRVCVCACVYEDEVVGMATVWVWV